MKTTLEELMERIRKRDSAWITDLLLDSKEWNRLIHESRELRQEISLTGLQINSADLIDLDLAGVRIEDSDFSGSRFTGIDLEESDIIDTDLSDLTISDTNLRNASISESSLENSRLYRTVRTGLRMTGSVNLLKAYIIEDPDQIREEYRTSPEITKKGFELAESYEHSGHDHDEERHYYQ